MRAFRQQHDSSSRVWRSWVCGRRTRPFLDCHESAFGALSQWCDAEKEDERMETPRGTLPIVGTPGGGALSAIPRDIESRESRSRVSELGCDSTRRTRSYLSLDQASDIGRVAQLWVSNHSTGAANSRAHIAARCGPLWKQGLVSGSGDAANVNRRAAANVQSSDQAPPRRLPLRVVSRWPSSPGKSRVVGKQAGFNLEDTFAASVEEFGSLIAEGQGLGGPGGLGQHRAGTTEMLSRNNNRDERERPTRK